MSDWTVITPAPRLVEIADGVWVNPDYVTGVRVRAHNDGASIAYSVDVTVMPGQGSGWNSSAGRPYIETEAGAEALAREIVGKLG